MAPISTLNDSSGLPLVVGWGLLCVLFACVSAYALLCWRQAKALNVKLKTTQARFRWMLLQKDHEMRAKDDELVALRGDNEGLRMQMMLLKRRVSEVWRGRLENEGRWLKEKQSANKVEDFNSQISALKSRLVTLANERVRLAEEKETLRTCMEKYGEEVLELRDKVSEYHHRLISGGRLDPLLYLPVQPLLYDDEMSTTGITRRSDNSRGTRVLNLKNGTEMVRASEYRKDGAFLDSTRISYCLSYTDVFQVTQTG